MPLHTPVGGLAVAGVLRTVVVEQMAHASTPECEAHMANWAERASISLSVVWSVVVTRI